MLQFFKLFEKIRGHLVLFNGLCLKNYFFF